MKQGRIPIKDPVPIKARKSGNGCCYCLTLYIGFIVVVFGLTAVNLHQFVYNYKHHELHAPGEYSVRQVGHDLNPILCRAYEVRPFAEANVFLIKGKAKVKRHDKKIIRRNTEQLSPGSLFLNNGFYLLEGSEIHVNGCQRGYPEREVVEILLFKGDKSWEKWSSGSCGDCYHEKVKITGRDRCSKNGGVKLKYKVKHRDSYYVALHKEDDYYHGFVANAIIKRTTFELDDVRESCHHTVDCYLNLTIGKYWDVVVQFPDSYTFSSFGTECKYRTVVWVAIFLVVPGFLIGIILLCCCCCRKCCDDNERKANCRTRGVATGSTADLLNNELPPDYQSTAHTGSIQTA